MPMIGGNNRPSLGSRLLGNINNVATRHWKSYPDTGRTNYTNTFNLITVAPCKDFTHVRLVYKNGDATPVNIFGALVAATASTSSRITPTTGSTLTNNGDTGWVQVTFAGSNAGVIQPGTSNNPAILVSDWVPLNSLTPTDGALYPYVMARTKFVESGTYSTTYIGTSNNTNTQDTYARCDSMVGDFVTQPESFSTQNGEVNSPVFGIEFKTSSPVIKILAVGSSTTMGAGSTPTDSLYRSWVPLTQEILRQTKIPTCLFNYAYSGRTCAQYAAIGKLAIEAHQPSIVLYPPFSTNDGTPTQSIVNAQYTVAIDFAEYAMSQGCLPVFTFLNPCNSYDATADGYRKSLIARCKASGFAVLDLTMVVGDNNTPQRFIPAFDSGDGVHCNDAGYAAQAAVAAPFLQQLLAQNISW